MMDRPRPRQHRENGQTFAIGFSRSKADDRICSRLEMTQQDYDSFSATMFKRLWWQGYQGRFAALRWPTYSADSAAWMGVFTFNLSEYVAF